MSQNGNPDRPAVSDSEHARIVAEVLEDQTRRRAVRDAARARPDDSDTSFFVQVGLLVTGTFFFYLLFFSPTWIAPTRAEPIAAAHVEEGLRFQIYLTANRVRAYLDEEGRLPASLDELEGAAREGVEYRRIDAGTFEVRAATGSTSLRYVSTQPLSEFYGDAGARIMGGTS